MATSRCPNTTFWLYVNAFYFVIILLTLLSLPVFYLDCAGVSSSGKSLFRLWAFLFL